MEQTSQGHFPAQLSIIVPITRMHGRLSGLHQWLAEVDFRKIEVILVHDVQDELTSIDLQSLIVEYPLIKLIEQTVMSAGLARNAGFRCARANWIVFWDSDDTPNVSALRHFLEHPDKESIDLFVFNFRIDTRGSISNYRTTTWKDIALNPGIWRIIISKSTISRHSFPSFPLGEDQYFLATLNLPSLRIRYIDEYLYTYQIGANGQATAIKSNLPRLRESLSAINSIQILQKGDSLSFTCILYWRQILTLLKRGSFSIKLEATSIILSNFLKHRSNYKINLQAMVFVFKKLMGRHV